jgi:hypothetical protein
LDSEATAGTETGDWEEVHFPGPVQIEVALATTAGTVTSADLEIQAADADDADGDPDEIQRLGRFSNFVATDDDVTFVLDVTCYKRFMRPVLITVGSGADVIATVTVRQRDVHRGVVGSGAVIS